MDLKTWTQEIININEIKANYMVQKFSKGTKIVKRFTFDKIEWTRFIIDGPRTYFISMKHGTNSIPLPILTYVTENGFIVSTSWFTINTFYSETKIDIKRQASMNPMSENPFSNIDKNLIGFHQWSEEEWLLWDMQNS